MAVTTIPNVTNWSVTPQNGQANYFTLMNTWLSESTTVIASLQAAITAQNTANNEINTLAEQTATNAQDAQDARDEAVTALALLSNGAIDDTTIATNKTFSNSYIQTNYYDKTQSDNLLSNKIDTSGTGLSKSGTTLNFYPFDLTTATTELSWSDYVVVSDNDIPKKITISDLLNEMLSSSGNAPYYGARARVTLNGQTASILSSGNISSITNNGVGDETVNLITAMPDANYQIQHTISQNTAAQYSVLNLVSKTTTSFRVQTSNLGGALLDVTTIDLTIVG